jgi:hypothetical protein
VICMHWWILFRWFRKSLSLSDIEGSWDI